MTSKENPYAGQGPVLLDIGGRIGALVISTPPWLDGTEIEARPVRPDPPAHLPHVEVLARQKAYTAVFAELEAGEYEFYERPGGPVRLTATVKGGEVAHATWPA